MKKNLMFGLIISLSIVSVVVFLYFNKLEEVETFNFDDLVSDLEICSNYFLSDNYNGSHMCCSEPEGACGYTYSSKGFPLLEDIEKLKLLNGIEGVYVARSNLRDNRNFTYYWDSDEFKLDCEFIWRIDYDDSYNKGFKNLISVSECEGDYFLQEIHTMTGMTPPGKIYKISLNESIIQKLKE